MLAPWKKSYNKPKQHIKKQTLLANKCPDSQNYGFSSSHVHVWELVHKEGWVPKNWCFQIMMLEKTLETPLDSKQIKSVNPKRSQLWILVSRIVAEAEAEAEASILWPPDVKSWLTRKVSNAGTDWKLKEEGAAEDEMVGWHHWLNGHELEQTPGDNGGEMRLTCCSPWDHKELDTT